jgi:peptidoglycan hydrolase CwlO-like protein
MKRSYLFAMALSLLYVSVAQAQYPMMDAIANKVIAKYQNSTCEQLWEKKSQKTPPTQQEQNAIQMLKSDPQMRQAFINKIAAPIANKMFECGMIP